jgi:hypothetical protein
MCTSAGNVRMVTGTISPEGCSRAGSLAQTTSGAAFGSAEPCAFQITLTLPTMWRGAYRNVWFLFVGLTLCACSRHSPEDPALEPKLHAGAGSNVPPVNAPGNAPQLPSIGANSNTIIMCCWFVTNDVKGVTH